MCFRSNVWNIGAEGQFIARRAWPAAAWRMQAGPADRPLGRGLPLILLAGVLGGMAWAAIVALLRDRFNANEILVSLMLVYVAQHAARATWSTGPGRTRRASTSRRPSPS
ncbi:MAG: hypothetical protein MZW92_00845 [Comamonadaceae bacterium]|nr:hypothetical protein [Comamonadaceae bacterium]